VQYRGSCLLHIARLYLTFVAGIKSSRGRHDFKAKFNGLVLVLMHLGLVLATFCLVTIPAS